MLHALVTAVTTLTVALYEASATVTRTTAPPKIANTLALREIKSIALEKNSTIFFKTGNNAPPIFSAILPTSSFNINN